MQVELLAAIAGEAHDGLTSPGTLAPRAEVTSAGVPGRFVLRAVTRPPVWPFLPGAVLTLSPRGATQALVRVATAGGALLRSYNAQAVARGWLVPRVEVQGHLLDLTLSAREHDGRHVLEGVWTLSLKAPLPRRRPATSARTRSTTRTEREGVLPAKPTRLRQRNDGPRRGA